MVDAVRRTPGVRLLDWSSDASHNRSVFTLVGDQTGVEAAVLALFERAVADIDLRTPKGEHPRLGAPDALPFLAIEGATMADRAPFAKKAGATRPRRVKGPPVFCRAAPPNP